MASVHATRHAASPPRRLALLLARNRGERTSALGVQRSPWKPPMSEPSHPGDSERTGQHLQLRTEVLLRQLLLHWPMLDLGRKEWETELKNK